MKLGVLRLGLLPMHISSASLGWTDVAKRPGLTKELQLMQRTRSHRQTWKVARASKTGQNTNEDDQECDLVLG